MSISLNKKNISNILLAVLSPLLFIGLLEIAGIFYMNARHTLHEHEIRIESQGILENNKKPGERRLFVIGESAVEGVPFTPDHSMSAFLSQLTQPYDPQLKIVNLGMQGKHSFYHREYGKALVKYKADGVLFYAGNNDSMPESNVMRDLPLARADLWLTFNSQFYFGFQRRVLWLKNLINQKLKRNLFDTNPYQDQVWSAGDQFKKLQVRYNSDPALAKQRFELSIQRYEENIEHLVKYLKHKQIKVWILELPTVHEALLDEHDWTKEKIDSSTDLKKQLSRAATELVKAGKYSLARESLLKRLQLSYQVRGGHPEKNKALQRLAARQDVPFIPLQNLLEGLSETGLVGRNFFLDECHPNFYGHKVIAARMMEALCVSKLISCRPPANAAHFLEKLVGKQDNQNLAREYFLVGFYQYKGTVWSNAPQYSEAAAYFEKALSIFPSYADVYPFLAASYAKLGESAKAQDVMQRLQSLNPSAYQKALYEFPDLRKP